MSRVKFPAEVGPARTERPTAPAATRIRTRRAGPLGILFTEDPRGFLEAVGQARRGVDVMLLRHEVDALVDHGAELAPPGALFEVFIPVVGDQDNLRIPGHHTLPVDQPPAIIEDVAASGAAERVARVGPGSGGAQRLRAMLEIERRTGFPGHGLDARDERCGAALRLGLVPREGPDRPKR